jgi:hypothetical protein
LRIGKTVTTNDEDKSLSETLHLLRSPANAARLLRSIDEANAGKLADQEILEQSASVQKRQARSVLFPAAPSAIQPPLQLTT